MSKIKVPTTEGDKEYRPSWPLVLSYDWHIREKAFELVRESGQLLMDALEAARKDSELRSMMLTTPLTI